MGDGGAYFIGFALAAMAILLVERNYPVSDFAVLLICVHPVTEVLFSMYRRAASGASITQPDRLHFHTLLKMRYIRRWFGHWPNVARNSIAGATMSLFTLLAVILAALSYKNVMLSAFFFVAMVAMYVTLYTRMARFGWNKPKRSKMPRAHARSNAQRTGRHQPPATSHQPPATSHQPPALTPPVQGIRACARPNPFRLSARSGCKLPHRLSIAPNIHPEAVDCVKGPAPAVKRSKSLLSAWSKIQRFFDYRLSVG